jgi:hypothetical protein
VLEALKLLRAQALNTGEGVVQVGRTMMTMMMMMMMMLMMMMMILSMMLLLLLLLLLLIMMMMMMPTKVNRVNYIVRGPVSRKRLLLQPTKLTKYDDDDEEEEDDDDNADVNA